MKVNIKKKIECIVNERRQNAFLDDESILEKSSSPKLAISLGLLISVLIMMILIWASFTEISEVAKTQGEVVPKNRIRLIQNMHGGIVESLHVKNGEIVKKGQPLLKLEHESLHAELEKNIMEIISLMANKIRIESQLNNTIVSNKDLQDAIEKQINIPKKYIHSIKSLISHEIKLLQHERGFEDSELKVIEQQMAQDVAEINRLKSKSALLKEMLDVMKQEKQMYEKLRKKDIVSKREFLISTRQFLKIKSEMEEANNQYHSQKIELLETKSKLDKKRFELKRSASEKINQINADVLQLKRNIEKLERQFDNLVLRAPVDGLVHSLNVDQGSIIKPSDVLLDIVPTSSPLVIETKILSEDIGHVKQNDKVKIKVTAYDYARYGMLNGTLESISASTYIDKLNNQHYYKGTILLDKDYVGNNPKRMRLLPGMTVEADIYTGEKSILSYLLKPIANTMSNSFGER